MIFFFFFFCRVLLPSLIFTRLAEFFRRVEIFFEKKLFLWFLLWKKEKGEYRANINRKFSLNPSVYADYICFACENILTMQKFSSVFFFLFWCIISSVRKIFRFFFTTFFHFFLFFNFSRVKDTGSSCNSCKSDIGISSIIRVFVASNSGGKDGKNDIRTVTVYLTKLWPLFAFVFPLDQCLFFFWLWLLDVEFSNCNNHHYATVWLLCLILFKRIIF